MKLLLQQKYHLHALPPNLSWTQLPSQEPGRASHHVGLFFILLRRTTDAAEDEVKSAVFCATNNNLRIIPTIGLNIDFGRAGTCNKQTILH